MNGDGNLCQCDVSCNGDKWMALTDVQEQDFTTLRDQLGLHVCDCVCVCVVGVAISCWLSGESMRKKKMSKMTPRFLS